MYLKLTYTFQKCLLPTTCLEKPKIWMAHNATVCFAKINHLQDNLRSKRHHNIPVIHRMSNQSWNKNKQNSHFLQVPSKWSIWLPFLIAFILFNCKNLSTSVSLNKCYFCLLSVFKTHVHFSEVFTSHYLLRKAKNVNGMQCNCLLCKDKPFTRQFEVREASQYSSYT